MQAGDLKYKDAAETLSRDISPPFSKSLQKYKWNVRDVRGTIGSEICVF